MTPEEYITVRVDEQIEWYSKKSRWSKRGYIGCQIVALIASACVPIVSLSSGEMRSRISVAALGAMTALATGFVSLFQFRERWVNYRTTSELLKHEKFRYLTGTAPYGGAHSVATLVDRVETLVSQENSDWKSRLTATGSTEE